MSDPVNITTLDALNTAEDFAVTGYSVPGKVMGHVSKATLNGITAAATYGRQGKQQLTINERIANSLMVNVLNDYDVDNTGVTDVTAVLQQAIDDRAAVVDRDNGIQIGGVLYLPAGFYSVTKLVLKYGVMIVGAGRAATVIGARQYTHDPATTKGGNDTEYGLIEVDQGAIQFCGLQDLRLQGHTTNWESQTTPTNPGQRPIYIRAKWDADDNTATNGGMYYSQIERVDIRAFDRGWWFRGGFHKNITNLTNQFWKMYDVKAYLEHPVIGSDTSPEDLLMCLITGDAAQVRLVECECSIRPNSMSNAGAVPANYQGATVTMLHIGFDPNADEITYNTGKNEPAAPVPANVVTKGPGDVMLQGCTLQGGYKALHLDQTVSTIIAGGHIEECRNGIEADVNARLTLIGPAMQNAANEADATEIANGGGWLFSGALSSSIVGTYTATGAYNRLRKPNEANTSTFDVRDLDGKGGMPYGYPSHLSGAAHDNTSDDTSLLNGWLGILPNRAKATFPSAKTSRITAPIIPPNDRYQIWDASGHSIIFDADSGVPESTLTAQYPMAAEDTVTAITNTTLTVRGVPRPVTELTLTTAANATLARYPEGRRIKLLSNDSLSDGTDSQNQQGEWLTIINVSSGKVITTRPHDSGVFVTNPRIALPVDAGLDINGLTGKYLDADVRANSQDRPQFRVIGGRRFHVQDVTSENASGIVIHGVGVEDFQVSGCNIGNAFDASYDLIDLATGDYDTPEDRVSSFGYGVADTACGNTRVTNNYFYNVRHGYTSNVIKTNSSPGLSSAYWGRSSNILVANNSFVGCFSSAVDTHAGCVNAVIATNTIEDCGGVAIAMRANQALVTGNTIRRAAKAAQVFREGSSKPHIVFGDNSFDRAGQFEVWGGATVELGATFFNQDIDGNGTFIRVKQAVDGIPARLYITGHNQLNVNKGSNPVIVLEAGANLEIFGSGSLTINAEDGTTGYQALFGFERSDSAQTIVHFNSKRVQINGTGWGDLFALYGSETGTVPPKLYGDLYKDDGYAGSVNGLTFTAGAGVQNLTDGFIV